MTRIVSSSFLVALLWFLVGYFQLLGVIGAVVSVIFLEFSIFTVKAIRILNASWADLAQFRDVGKIFIAAALAGCVATVGRMAVPEAHAVTVLIIGALVFTVVYPASLLLLKISISDELRLAQGMIGSLRRFLPKKKSLVSCV
jgi:hypothetical protein